jgi:hypothetical protein
MSLVSFRGWDFPVKNLVNQGMPNVVNAQIEPTPIASINRIPISIAIKEAIT